MKWSGDNFTEDNELGKVASNNDSTSIISSTPSMRHVYEKNQEFLSRDDVHKLNSANKDGTSADVLRARIASLVDNCPDSYQNFEVEWDDNTLILPSITEVILHIRVSEIKLAEKTRCIQSCISHLPDNSLLDSVDSFAFIRYAKQCKDVLQYL
jgi:hypothetical protein